MSLVRKVTEMSSVHVRVPLVVKRRLVRLRERAARLRCEVGIEEHVGRALSRAVDAAEREMDAVERGEQVSGSGGES